VLGCSSPRSDVGSVDVVVRSGSWQAVVAGGYEYTARTRVQMVLKVCNSCFAHTFGVLLIKVITKCKTWDYQCVHCCEKYLQVLKSVCKVCNPHVGHA